MILCGSLLGSVKHALLLILSDTLRGPGAPRWLSLGPFAAGKLFLLVGSVGLT